MSTHPIGVLGSESWEIAMKSLLCTAMTAPLLLLLVSCSGATQPASNPQTTDGPQQTAAGSPRTWAETTSKDQKVAFMKTHVVPAMAEVFAQGPEGDEPVTCKTCHGPNYQEPKDFLPKLQFEGGKFTAEATMPEVVSFMKSRVVPAMAAALGEQPYDPATHQGFGCSGCHTVEMR
jgi:cytochrome c553